MYRRNRFVDFVEDMGLAGVLLLYFVALVLTGTGKGKKA